LAERAGGYFVDLNHPRSKAAGFGARVRLFYHFTPRLAGGKDYLLRESLRIIA